MRDPGDVRTVVLSPEISWRHLTWLRGITTLPIVLKGVLHPEDARLAARHGMDGLIVSSRGGPGLQGGGPRGRLRRPGAGRQAVGARTFGMNNISALYAAK